MPITEQDIQKLSELSKLDLSLDTSIADVTFKNKLINNLNNILDLVEQLRNIDTSNIEPMIHADEHAKQRLRPDTVTEDNVRDIMQSTAPANSLESGLYLVPKVIDHS